MMKLAEALVMMEVSGDDGDNKVAMMVARAAWPGGAGSGGTGGQKLVALVLSRR